MRHVGKCVPVHVIILTDGAYGEEGETRLAYSHKRQEESLEAAMILGYGVPTFLGFRDREVVYSEKLVSQMLGEIGNADLVYAPSVFEIHPDHRAIGMAAIEAVRRIRQGVRLALYEVGTPLRPNLLLDISDIAERKMSAMQCFSSQNVRQRYDLDIAALNRYRSYTLENSVTAAEAYILTRAEDLAKDPMRLYESEYRRQKALGLKPGIPDTPRVSVIVRSMDRVTLSDALDSIALQTYPNIEVIVVNAKGHNHSEVDQWCGRFPMRVVGQGEPLRRSRAANMGLEAATGQYVIFLDDDDWFEPHHIAALTGELDNDESVVLVYSAMRGVNALGEEIRRFEEAYDPVQLRIDNYIPIHAALFRRFVADRGVRFDESLEICEDWDFWLQISEHGPFRFVANIGGGYRIGNGKGSGVWDDAARTRQAMLGIYKKWFPRWSEECLWSIFEYARYKRLFHGEVPGLRQSIADSDRKLKELVAQHEDQTAKTQKHIAQMANQIANLENSLKEREREISALLSSRSWRLTKPIRSIKTFFQERKWHDQ